MNNCNVPNKKILVTSNNKFSQEIAVLRKIVVQANTLPLVIAIFTVEILFILCAHSLGYILPLVKKKDTDLCFFLFFRRSLLSEAI